MARLKKKDVDGGGASPTLRRGESRWQPMLSCKQGEACPICLEPIPKDGLYLPCCSHGICRPCSNEYGRRMRSSGLRCPLCRSKPLSQAEVLSKLTVHADRGDEAAQTRLGLACLKGAYGVYSKAECVKKAVRYLGMAAEQGSTPAALGLAEHYRTGSLGTTPDAAKAEIYFKIAADRGDPAAQYALGYSYICGERKVRAGIGYYERAAEAGHAQALVALGVILSPLTTPLDGVPKDAERAKGYLARAAAAGSVRALVCLGSLRLDGQDRDVAQGEKCLVRAADLGDVEAQLALARHYLHGRALKRNLPEAARLFELAAKQGNADAKTGLAILRRLNGVDDKVAQRNSSRSSRASQTSLSSL